MNNMNPQVHVAIKSKLKPHSDEWIANLRKLVRDRLTEMQREFSEAAFLNAIKTMDHHQLALSGVTFLLYLI